MSTSAQEKAALQRVVLNLMAASLSLRGDLIEARTVLTHLLAGEKEEAATGLNAMFKADREENIFGKAVESLDHWLKLSNE